MAQKALKPLETLPPLGSNSNLLKNSEEFFNTRKDGRKTNEIRQIFARTTVSNSAKGSAYISVGTNIKVLCCVYGPKPIISHGADIEDPSQGEISVTVIKTPFASTDREKLACTNKSTSPTFKIIPVMKSEDKLSNTILETFNSVVLTEQLPNASVDITLLIISGDQSSGLVPASINCVSLALIDAGVPVRDLCVAVRIAIMPNSPNSSINLLDPTETEIEQCLGHATIAMCVSQNLIAYVDASLQIPNCLDQFMFLNEILNLAEFGCTTLGNALREHIVCSKSKTQTAYDKNDIERV